MWTSPLSVKPSNSFISVVFIQPYVHRPDRRFGFLSLMGVRCFSCCLHVWCRLVLARACFSSSGWELLSRSLLAHHYQLERLSDELQKVGFLRGEPEQSSAGEHFVWPALIMLDIEQTQQFSWWVMHRETDWALNLLIILITIIISDERKPRCIWLLI